MEYTLNIEEELFLLKSDVIELEAENTDLRNQVNNLKCIKEQLEQFIMDMGGQEEKKKIKQPRKISDTQKQFQEFYKSNKNNVSIRESLKTKLESLGMLEEAKKIPWYIVRNECKRLFNEQSNAKS